MTVDSGVVDVVGSGGKDIVPSWYPQQDVNRSALGIQSTIRPRAQFP